MSTPLIDDRKAADITTTLVGTDGNGLLYQCTSTTDPQNHYPWHAWQELDPTTLQPTGPSAALIGIFSRWAELIIERLNRVPDKNFVAFLNMLGAAQLPPEPARVPITFALAAGRTTEATVPLGTRVAAPAGPDAPQPAVFEIERPLVVVAARLESLVTLDPMLDTYADRSDADGAAAFPVFQGDHQLEHVLYIGDDELFGYSAIAGLRANVTLTASLPAPPAGDLREVIWQRWDGVEWTELTPSNDSTAALMHDGTIVFALPSSPVEGGISVERTINSQASRWLRCQLKTPITIGSPGASGMVSCSQLPVINSLGLEVALARSGITADLGFTNTTALDLSNGFYPFGEKPKRFDTFYVGSREAFSKDGVDADPSVARNLVLTIALANPTDPQAPGHIVHSTDLALAWEYWDGKAWKPFLVGGSGVNDTTANLTVSGTVTLTLPAVAAALATVNGEENYFIRARISAGNYGVEGYYVPVNPGDLTKGYYYVAATYGPPIISSLSIAYNITKKRAPKRCVTYNALEFEDVTGTSPFAPFAAYENQDLPDLYLGFSLPNGVNRFPNTTLSVYASVAGALYGERLVPLSPLVSFAVGTNTTVAIHHFTITNASGQDTTYSVAICGETLAKNWTWSTTPSTIEPLFVGAGETLDIDVTVTFPTTALTGDTDRAFLKLSDTQDPDPAKVFAATLVTAVGNLPVPEAPSIHWSYWNGQAWTSLMLQRDETLGFERPGLMQFIGPPDFATSRLFGKERYWARASFDPGDGSVVPRLRRLHLNTTTAIQSSTIVNEMLGSSNGDEGQTFRTTRTPVLSGQSLEVRELELPTAAERAVLEREEGDDAVRVVADSAGQPSEVWVRWHEMPDFYVSGPRDRHYVIDHLTGEIRFGNGESGWIPPLGINNVRMASYRTGGGTSGNRAIGTVTQLKTTVPYVEKPTNPEAATGGAEAETVDAVRERVPRALRHRNRAVTVEDYEDMAKLASLEVAHTRCVPLRNLETDPLGSAPFPGMSSVIVVPLSTEQKPLPSRELLSRVETFLEQRVPAGASLVVVGPTYIRIDVTIEVAITSDAVVPVVKTAIEQRLGAFLHPLTGGLDGTGWDFGREAHKSDFYPLIEGVPGVDHVRYLQVNPIEELAGIRQTGCFLIYSGQHRVDVVFTAT
jgi:hypothetical protein